MPLRDRHGEPLPPRGPAFQPITTADLATLAAFVDANPERTCAGCDAVMVAKRADARFCGKACKSHAERARHAVLTAPGPPCPSL